MRLRGALPEPRTGGLWAEGASPVAAGRDSRAINMAVPIDLLKPILHDLTTLGRVSGPPRPWLGLYATEMDDQVVVMGLSPRAPAEAADLRAGDILLAVGETDAA